MKILKFLMVSICLMLFVNINAKAQMIAMFYLGKSENEMKPLLKVIKETYPIEEQGFAQNGMPFYSFSTYDKLQRELFYFSNGQLVMHRRLIPKRFAADLIKELKDSGFVFKDGRWIEEGFKIVAAYDQLDNVISISFTRIE